MERLYADQLVEHYSELAHHYSRSGNTEKAVDYLQLAGEQAVQRSATAKAMTRFNKALALIAAIPPSIQRTRQAIDLQSALGPVLIATKGYASDETTTAYTQALTLCEEVGDSQRRYPLLWGVWASSALRGEYAVAHTLAKQLLHVAEETKERSFLVEAYAALGVTRFWLGDFLQARSALEQGVLLYDAHKDQSHAFVYGQDPAVICLSYAAWTLWALGYADQGRARVEELLDIAARRVHPFSTGMALNHVAWFYAHCQAWRRVQYYADEAYALADREGFPFWLAEATILRGRAVIAGSASYEGVEQMVEGLTAYRTTVAELGVTNWLGLLAEGYGTLAQPQQGLEKVAEALKMVATTGERQYEAELYRLKGELTLQKLSVVSSQLSVPSPQSRTPNPQAEAEECFLKAIEVARKQHAKSLELRATMSLARLWQQQGKQHEAHQMLSEVYNWFTEGFDTKDLQEAKALLNELSQ
jgi:predicted ATPase